MSAVRLDLRHYEITEPPCSEFERVVLEAIRAQASEDALRERVRVLEENKSVIQKSYDELLPNYCNLRDRLFRLRNLAFPCPHCGKNRFKKSSSDFALGGGKESE
jgi:predicted nuclease with TOPRIM domain